MGLQSDNHQNSLIMEEHQSKQIKRIAAAADLHVRETDKGKWTDFFKDASKNADVLVICGDLTDTGDEAEAQVLADEMKACTIPVVCVLGNHDYEKGRHKLIRQTLQKDTVHVLDGEAVIIGDVGFAGVKGFGGGFDNHMLSMFGEVAMKAFVQEGVDEALHMERALTRLDAHHQGITKIALFHYSPIKETVIGEPEPIFPFLGCSRLAEPLTRIQVAAAFHGHAHAGTLEGKTANGTPVFNVSKPILAKAGHAFPYFMFEL
jgi:Icc-related predicted phosphoesterase